MVVALLLAAGLGRRFGGSKLTADAGGMPLVRRTALALLDSSVDRVLVVTGHDAQRVRAALDGLDIHFVDAPAHAEGLGASLRTGVQALPANASHALVALGDQPGAARRSVVDAVVARSREGGAAIVSARYRGVAAPPVLFERSLFPELLLLGGDAGARALVMREAARVEYVDFDIEAPIDVDTEGDLHRLREELGA